MAGHILVIDQGATSTRRIVFDAPAAPVATARQEFAQICPRPALSTARQASRTAGRRFVPALPQAERDRKYRGWQDALARALLRP